MILEILWKMTVKILDREDDFLCSVENVSEDFGHGG